MNATPKSGVHPFLFKRNMQAKTCISSSQFSQLPPEHAIASVATAASSESLLHSSSPYPGI
jgi:hypothetical protein